MSDDDVRLPDPAAESDTPEAPDELALARELILRGHPEAVHELIVGQSLAELLGSVPAAEAVYKRVADATRTAAVPGGGTVRSATVDLEGLGPLAKIRAGLQRP